MELGGQAIQNASFDPEINAIAAGLSLAVLVALATIGNIILLAAVGFVVRAMPRGGWMAFHKLIFAFSCLELLYALVPCLIATVAYLTSWNVVDNQSVCDFMGWVALTLRVGSMWISTTLAVERYLVVSGRSRLTEVMAERLMYAAIGGLFLIFVLSAVPLMREAHMVSLADTSGSYCHFEFTPKTTHTRAFAIAFVVLMYCLLQVSLFCHVSLLCQRSHDRSSPTKDGVDRNVHCDATLPSRRQDEVQSVTFSSCLLSLWLWICALPFTIAVILAQSQYEIGAKFDFAIVRILTVCSTLNPYVILATCGNYRAAFYDVICCREVESTFLAADNTRYLEEAGLQGELCRSSGRSELVPDHRLNMVTNVCEDVNIHAATNNHAHHTITQDQPVTSVPSTAADAYPDWPLVPVVHIDHADPAHSARPILVEDTQRRSTSTLQNDSRIFVISHGQNGDLVYRTSYDGGPLPDDEWSRRSVDHGDSYSSEGSGSWSEYSGKEDGEYFYPESSDSHGYVITLPVNMPGRGSSETVERIFYIQEPVPQLDSTFENGASVPNHEEKRSVDHSFPVAGQISSAGSVARTAFREGGTVAFDRDSYDVNNNGLSYGGTQIDHLAVGENDEDLQELELTRIEAEIRGRILGRADLRRLKGRRSSAPPNIVSTEDIPVETSLCQQAMNREQTVRLHGPLSTDPQAVTLAFQQAMMAHAQQIKIRSEHCEKSTKHGNLTRKHSSMPTVPVISITSAEDGDDESNDGWSQRGRGSDYRFLAPIAEEVGFTSDRSSPRSSPRSSRFLSMLTTKHEKVHRVPRTTLQIMSTMKLQEDLLKTSSPPSSSLSAEANSQIDLENRDASRCSDNVQEAEHDERKQYHSDGDLKRNRGTSLDISAETDPKHKVSSETLEEVGNIVERLGREKHFATDPLLQTPEWELVEQAMQGKVNVGFVSDEDDLAYQREDDNRKSHFPGRETDIRKCSSVVNEAGGGQRMKTCPSVTLTRQAKVRDDSIPDSGDASDPSSQRDNSLTLFETTVPTFPEDEFTLSAYPEEPPSPLQRLDQLISDSSGHSSQDEKSTSNDDNEQRNSEISEEGELRLVDVQEINETSDSDMLTQNDLTQETRGQRSPKIPLHGISSYPLLRMPAFSMDGSLYILYPNKLNGREIAEVTISGSGSDLNGSKQIRRVVRVSSLGNEGDLKEDINDESMRPSVLPIKRRQFLDIHEKRQLPGIKVAMV
ncbi:uncharacterized protein [Diadema antillarum]|uniref:uncharacterized protein n=1 Tax=Diadema antillarum TaxID=105358 RepID=UPI003A8A9EFC